MTLATHTDWRPYRYRGRIVHARWDSGVEQYEVVDTPHLSKVDAVFAENESADSVWQMDHSFADANLEAMPIGWSPRPKLTQGVKYDGGKLRYHLVDPFALAWLVASLTYGAAKYTRRGECTCGAGAARRSTRKGAAGTATTSSSSNRTLSMPSGSEPMLQPGLTRTERARTSTRLSGESERIHDSGPTATSDTSTGSHPSSTRPSSLEGARSADPSTGFGSITTMPQEPFAGVSATPATSDLGSSSDPTNGLTEHSPTCGVHHEVSGEENWRDVEDANKRYYASLLRHLEAWRAGEADDPESGLHHLSGVLFAAMCLAALNAPRDLKTIEAAAREAVRRWKERSTERVEQG